MRSRLKILGFVFMAYAIGQTPCFGFSGLCQLGGFRRVLERLGSPELVREDSYRSDELKILGKRPFNENETRELYSRAVARLQLKIASITEGLKRDPEFGTTLPEAFAPNAFPGAIFPDHARPAPFRPDPNGTAYYRGSGEARTQVAKGDPDRTWIRYTDGYGVHHVVFLRGRTPDSPLPAKWSDWTLPWDVLAADPRAKNVIFNYLNGVFEPDPPATLASPPK